MLSFPVSADQNSRRPALQNPSRKSVHLTPVFSSGSALLRATEHSQPLCNQSFPHSFPCNGGGTLSSLPTLVHHRLSISSLESPLAKVVQNKRLYLPLKSTLTKKRG